MRAEAAELPVYANHLPSFVHRCSRFVARLQPPGFQLILFFLGGLIPCLYANAQPLQNVRSWGYWLQDINLPRLAASPYDLVVIDYSADGSQTQQFSAEAITELKDAGKIVLAYLSIGEAEKVRFYWKRGWARGRQVQKGAPRWLDAANPQFPDNFKVRFWAPGWQRIIFGRAEGRMQSYLDRIVSAGFDGVYLDIVDGYEYWKYTKRPRAARKSKAPELMARFVSQLSSYARLTLGRANFLVIPQNGSGILDELSPSARTSYLDAIDGIGAEDTFFFGDADENNELNPQSSTIAALSQFQAAGKPVFSVDYLTDSDKVSEFIQRACAQGFVPQVATRALAEIDSQTLAGCP